jgi:endonuclease YncB( thermonuclease family)
MPYTLLCGQFVIRYPDIPRQGPEPDGDTVKFKPETPALVDALPRRSGRPAEINGRGVSVRLEAIDALETHFGENHQEILGARAARDVLLAGLGFTNVKFYQDLPNKVEKADKDSLPGYVLSNGIDANGRMIGFVYPGNASSANGSSVFLDEAGVDGSVNAHLLTDGLVYPAFYGTLPASLRVHLARSSRSARAAGVGIWPRTTADPRQKATIANLEALDDLVLWPKLFRRLVPYLAAGNTNFDKFDAWLRAEPVDRDDKLFLLQTAEPGNMHDIISAAGQQVQLTTWPEDFVIEPDPAPPGTTTSPRRYSAGDVVIVAALPNPVGADRENESASLVNVTSMHINLQRWAIAGRTGRTQQLGGVLAGGEVLQVKLGVGLALGNRGGTLSLLDPSGAHDRSCDVHRSRGKAGAHYCVRPHLKTWPGCRPPDGSIRRKVLSAGMRQRDGLCRSREAGTILAER